MERQQLIKLIDNKGTSSKEETTELWDIVRTYPYFQTARLLLAKSFHNQNSIHFHNELKTASAYASDRKVLFHLIRQPAETTKQKPEEESNIFAIESNQAVVEAPVLKSGERYSENQFAIPEQKEIYIETPVFEIKEAAPAFTESKKEIIAEEKRSEQEVQKEEVIAEKKSSPPPLTPAYDEPATTNEEIIRRRLSEILSKNKPEQEIIPEITVSKVEEPIIKEEEVAEEKVVPIESITAKEEEPVTHSILDELPSEPVDVIEGLEIETIIEENYLQELEKLPEISPSPFIPQRVESASIESSRESISFINWLKQKNQGHTTVEEVIDEVEVEPEKDSMQIPPLGGGGAGALIDKFIATKPRIAPVKAEFYSPSNMARQSIIDNEDIISVTLARIYFDQGNYAKARSCYERLSLLYPEKSASFAPLIQKIDDILKEIT